GGVFVVDYWNGTAVARDHAAVRERRVREENREVLRISETTIDSATHTANVTFTFKTFESGRKIDEFQELHTVRFFFFDEIEALLAASGFTIAHVSPFMELNRRPQPSDWNISIAAVAS